jgi:flagellar biosynthesis protein
VAELLAWLHRLESEPAQAAPGTARTSADDVTDVVAVDIEGAAGAR